MEAFIFQLVEKSEIMTWVQSFNYDNQKFPLSSIQFEVQKSTNEILFSQMSWNKKEKAEGSACEYKANTIQQTKQN